MFLERSVKKLISLSFSLSSLESNLRPLLLSIECDFPKLPQERTEKKEMISILAQERLLGASLGAVFTGGIVFYQRRGIHRSLHGIDSTSYEPIKLTPGNVSSDLAHAWNKTVDLTLGQVVKFLSSRGW